MGDVDLEKRPGILFIGSPNVGKRSLLSRLLSVDFEDSSSQLLVHGWTINTQYYTADVSVWMAHLNDQFCVEALPVFNQLAALVMVFDITDLSSLVALQHWVASTHLQKFDVLLCVGNKVDLLPAHPVHSHYRKHLLKHSSSSDFSQYGISQTEGTSLLGDELSSSWEDTRSSCFQWCIDRNIEFVEACALNPDFDNCLSVDGDLQGVERICGALFAHMWPGMLLKSGDKITKPTLPNGEELSEEESDFEIEYEILSTGSAEPADDVDKSCSSNGEGSSLDTSVQKDVSFTERDQACQNVCDETENLDGQLHLGTDPGEGKHFDFEDLERLMSEIGNMRGSLRLMPDFQRREMAAKLALKMAAMFGGSSDDEEEIR